MCCRSAYTTRQHGCTKFISSRSTCELFLSTFKIVVGPSCCLTKLTVWPDHCSDGCGACMAVSGAVCACVAYGRHASVGAHGRRTSQRAGALFLTLVLRLDLRQVLGVRQVVDGDRQKHVQQDVCRTSASTKIHTLVHQQRPASRSMTDSRNINNATNQRNFITRLLY